MRITFEENYREDSFVRERLKVHHSIQELLEQAAGDTAIALIDDNVVSGSQAFAQVAAWMGVERRHWPNEIAQEENIDNTELPEDMQDKLWGRMAGYTAVCASVAAPKKSQKLLNEVFQAIRLNRDRKGEADGVQGTLFETSDTLRLYCGQMLDERSGNLSPFEKFLSHVGASVYAHAKYGKSLKDLNRAQRQACKNNALGYDNMGGRYVTHRNVPVSTFTAIWCPGIYEDRPWMPLAIRRGYSKKLVLG